MLLISKGIFAFEFDYNYENKNKELILNDFENLQAMKFSHSPELNYQKVFDTEDASAIQLMEWTSKRVKYFVDSSHRSNRLFIKNSYQTAKVNYVSNLGGDLVAQDGRNYGINLGAFLFKYAKEKDQNLVYEFRESILSFKDLVIDSPRVGIIDMFPELFRVNLNSSNSKEHVSNSIFRLSVLFHEARHSDGIFSNVGFPHSQCPKGHSYAGLFACDFSLNGSYAVSAEFLKYAIKDCDECSESEKTSLELIMLDNYDRIIKEKRVVLDNTNDELKTIKEKVNSSYLQNIKDFNYNINRIFGKYDDIDLLNESYFTRANELGLMKTIKARYELVGEH